MNQDATHDHSFFKKIEKEIKAEFDRTNRILSFHEYLDLVKKSPQQHTRSSAQYILDMMDHFGRTGSHFKLFDMEFEDPIHRVIAQDEVQQEIYHTLQSFVKEGINNKLLLLHGPNGSSKSTIVNCIIRGMEHYSELSEGACYRFNWIFPIEKYLKGAFGLASYSGTNHVDSYAKLTEDEISAKINCELKDHPLLLLPQPMRHNFWTELLPKNTLISEYLTRGSLCHKCKMIFEALLSAYKGDLRKVLQHVQVERFYISKRYRSGVATIEPQLHVDAQSRQITIDKSWGHLPASLQSLSFHELTGDLIDGNRGLIEYADLLKRPMDTFKYLLIACESGSVNVGSTIAFLDSVLIGSTNELQLDAFKEFPDFTSFKARIHLIRVPYLLEYSREKQIYDLQIHKIAGAKHLTPHTTFVCALWAVLTRLKKPNAIHYPPNLSNMVGTLLPLEKAKLYDHGGVPANLSAEERKLIKSNLQKLCEEYSNVPYFEGRMGASAREIKNILYDAAQNPQFPCLGPFAIFKELEDFTKHITEYDFLKQDIKDGYHDNFEFIHTTKNEYLSVLDQEIRESMGVFQNSQYEDFLKKYIIHLSHLLKHEKIKNPITGKTENPDISLIEEFETIMEASAIGTERDNFRNNIISTIGAYALDHPKQPVDYRTVFPEYLRKLEDHYFKEHKAQITKLGADLASIGTDKEDKTTDGHKLAAQTLSTMVKKFNYCELCAKQSVLFLIKSRY